MKLVMLPLKNFLSLNYYDMWHGMDGHDHMLAVLVTRVVLACCERILFRVRPLLLAQGENQCHSVWMRRSKSVF